MGVRAAVVALKLAVLVEPGMLGASTAGPLQAGGSRALGRGGRRTPPVGSETELVEGLAVKHRHLSAGGWFEGSSQTALVPGCLMGGWVSASLGLRSLGDPLKRPQKHGVRPADLRLHSGQECGVSHMHTGLISNSPSETETW